MPIYEYFCNDCGNQFEELKNFTQRDDEVQCPRCKSKNTKRMVSVFGKCVSSGTSSSSSSDSGCKFG